MLSQDLDKLILYSTTQQTWARHCSMWKLYNSFCRAIGIDNSLPIEIKNAFAFVTWAITKKGLKSSTVKAYLGSLNVAHVICNSKRGNFSSDKCIKMVLKDAENLEKIKGACKIDRPPMTYDLLAIFGHRLAKLNWNDYSIQIFWTAASISFFTFCRMGELLPNFEKGFDPKTTVLWQNVKFLDEKEAIIYIPFCKTKGFKGKIIDIYHLRNDTKCPAAALNKLRKMAFANDLFDPSRPVFAFEIREKFHKKRFSRKVLNSYLKIFVMKITILQGTLSEQLSPL